MRPAALKILAAAVFVLGTAYHTQALTTPATGAISHITYDGPTPVPDGGSTLALLGLALLAVALLRRRFTKR